MFILQQFLHGDEDMDPHFVDTILAKVILPPQIGRPGTAEESLCILPEDPSNSVGTRLEEDPDFDLFSDICLREGSARVARSRCSNKLAIFTTRHGYKLSPPDPKMIIVESKEDCQHRQVRIGSCLNLVTFFFSYCRSQCCSLR